MMGKLLADLRARGETDAADVLDVLYTAVMAEPAEVSFVVRASPMGTAVVEFANPADSMVKFIGRRFVLDSSYQEVQDSDL